MTLLYSYSLIIYHKKVMTAIWDKDIHWYQDSVAMKLLLSSELLSVITACAKYFSRD